MAEDEPIVEAQVVPGTDVVPVTPRAIFKTDDPMEIMQRTSQVASALKEFIDRQGLVSKISGRDYIVVEGWQMLGMMLGVTPGKVVTTPVADGWSASVELHDSTGRTIGSGDAECLATERTWKGRDDYARKSMAQTRAVSKAFRNTFGFIAKAAGYEATPAEEMPTEAPAETSAAAPPFGIGTADGYVAQTRRAIAYVLGAEQADQRVGAAIDRAIGSLRKQGYGGAAEYLPFATCVGICALATAVKEQREPAAPPPGQGDPSQETAEERAEREHAERVIAESESQYS